MANDKTITSANSVFTITAPGLYDSPVQLQGYATDDAFATEDVELAETMMGVDGRMSAGYTPNITPQTIALQADSDSIDVFDTIIAQTKVAREVFFLNGTLTLPATSKGYTMTRGVLQKVKQIPDGKKVLQPVKYTIHWESVDAALV